MREAIMDTVRVTENEFQRAVSSLTEKALETPVTITKNGRDHVVVLSAEEYARLKRRDRQVGLAAELPEEWIDPVRNARVPREFDQLDRELE
jgi:prevent-host-death family protein